MAESLTGESSTVPHIFHDLRMGLPPACSRATRLKVLLQERS